MLPLVLLQECTCAAGWTIAAMTTQCARTGPVATAACAILVTMAVADTAQVRRVKSIL